MAIVTRRYVVSGPGLGYISSRVPTASVIERYRTPVALAEYDDTDPGTLTDLDMAMEMLGYEPFNGLQDIEVFERAAHPAAVAGRVRVYAVLVAGVVQLCARASDGTISQLTPTYNGLLDIGTVALGAAVNDWAPAGYNGESVIMVDTSTGGGSTITGLDLGAFQIPGKVVSIQQTGAIAIDYSNEDAGSAADNQLRVGPHTAGQYAVMTMRYTDIGGGSFRWLKL